MLRIISVGGGGVRSGDPEAQVDESDEPEAPLTSLEDMKWISRTIHAAATAPLAAQILIGC